MLKARSGYWHIHLRELGVRKSTGIRVGDDKRLAWEEHNRVEQEALAGQKRGTAKGTAMTLEDAYDAAMLHHPTWRDSTSPSTIEGNYKRTAGYFGSDRAVATIGEEDVDAWQHQMRSEKLSPSTVNQRLSLLSVLFDWAKVEKPKLRRAKMRKGRLTILSHEEEAKVLDYFTQSALVLKDKQGRERTVGMQRDLAMVDLVVVLIDTGFRLSEMLRVGVREVSFERNTVAAWETKGDQPRIIPMTPRVRAVMERRLAGLKPSDVTARAFPGLTVDAADDCWERCRDSIGMAHEPEFVIHALRHSCCSRMVAAGMDAFSVQAWMGHKNIATTQRYVTLDPSKLTRLADALSCATQRATAVKIEAEKSTPELALS